MTETILFVDDEPNVLAAFRRQFHTQFQITTATGGQEALAMITLVDPFAVIVSDLRMPGMDGVQFLAKARNLTPESTRILLTGHADLATAIDAVNDGYIFRFLTKPCSPEILASALWSGLEQYRLITSERELLEKTLSKSVQLLTEIISLASPAAFSRAVRLRKIVMRIVSNLKLANAWQYELATTLSQIGCIALPPALVEKLATHQPLSKTDERLFDSHPMIGYRLLESIPRLGAIAGMIRGQNEPFASYSDTDRSQTLEVVQGAQLLKVALGYEQLAANQTEEHIVIVRFMGIQVNNYNPKMVAALGDAPILEDDWTMALVNLETVQPGMIANEEITTRDGKTIVPKGFEINALILERLHLAAQGSSVVEPFRVLVAQEPKSEEEGEDNSS
jgi:response regulator RpfG family c-di-GMP phosphodiesterase